MTPMPSPPAAKPDGKIGLLFQSFPDHWCNRWSSILQCHTLVEQLNFTPEKRPKLLSYLAIIPLMEKQHLASSKSKPEKKAIRINMKNKVWVRTICTSAASHPSFFFVKNDIYNMVLECWWWSKPSYKKVSVHVLWYCAASAAGFRLSVGKNNWSLAPLH